MTLDPEQPLLRVVSQSNLKGTTEGVYYQAPDVLLDAVTVRQYVHAEPFYWRLPEQFQGDQVRPTPGLEPVRISQRRQVSFEITTGCVSLPLREAVTPSSVGIGKFNTSKNSSGYIWLSNNFHLKVFSGHLAGLAGRACDS